jgi:hypothetical protein
MADQNPRSVGIGTVVDAELKDIYRRRGKQGPEPDPDKKWPDRCLDMKLFGVALSGGGIRSATFALGILQGLAE